MTGRLFGCALVLFAFMAWPRPVAARVDVQIGINLPGPPQLVPVPSSPVVYAPGGTANHCFYAGQYYVFTGGVWYTGPGYNGPWTILPPAYAALPLLGVPLRYFRASPRARREWPREAPPRWEAKWGRHRRGREEHEHEEHEEHEEHARYYERH